MGKETISSQELSDYTHVNSTQIRRDLSRLRQVRQARRRLQRRLARLADPQDPADRRPAQHRAVRRRPPRQGDRLVGHLRRPRLPRRGDLRRRRAQGRASRSAASAVRHIDELRQVVEEEDIVVGVLAVPTAAAQPLADELVEAGVKIIFNYSEALLARAAGGHGPHLEPGRRPAPRAVLLPDMSLDLDAGRGASRSRPTGPSASRRSSRSSTPRRSTSCRASRSCATPAQAADAVLRDSIAGELISSEIEIRSGRGDDLHDAIARQRDARTRLFALAAAPRRRARRDRHASVGRLPRAAQHRHRALPPRRRRACSTSRGATTPSRCTSTSASATSTARCAPATACGRCCRCCWRSAPTRRSSRAATAGCTPPARRPSRKSSRAAASPTPTAPGRPTASTSSSSSATNSIVEYTQVWWSVRPHFAFGTVEVRICDAQATAAESPRRSPR